MTRDNLIELFESYNIQNYKFYENRPNRIKIEMMENIFIIEYINYKEIKIKSEVDESKVQNWILCCEYLNNIRNRIKRNVIEKNEEYILDKFREHGINEPKFNFEKNGLMITVKNNGRDYMIKTDKIGRIYLYTLKFCRNSTQKFHYVKKKRIFYDWNSCCIRLNTAHKDYKTRKTIFEKLIK